MIENDVVVTTKYGRQPSFAVCPDEPGQFPAIILYMDAPGIREELRDQARRIAKHGYFCLLPDLYYRLGTLRFDIPRRDEGMSVVIRGAMKSLTNVAVTDDTAGMLAFLDAQEKVKPGPVGCVGHCMSGPFATTAAARFPRMKVAASLYGVEMVEKRQVIGGVCRPVVFRADRRTRLPGIADVQSDQLKLRRQLDDWVQPVLSHAGPRRIGAPPLDARA